MWNTTCSNKICFTKEKTYEQNLHLKRLYTIRPRITITEPYFPFFMKSGGWQREKKRQEEDKVEKINNIYFTKIFDARLKPGDYNKKKIKPGLYPAFKKLAGYKISDILKILKIKKDNMKMENKISEIKSDYERNEMRKEAQKQKLYLNNLLNRPKSIPYAPQLNFISIDQINNRMKRNQGIKSQKHFMTQSSIINNVRVSSMRQLRNNMNNISIKLSKNKSMHNRTNSAKKNQQNSKSRKSLDLEVENNFINNKNQDMANSILKKTNKKETTTKCTTGMKK